MIHEVIVTTPTTDGGAHLAPMGVHERGERLVVAPFRPSASLDNLLRAGCAVVNYTDDVRIFAGCLTGRRDWPLSAADTVPVPRLTHALAHAELRLESVEDDAQRPRLVCRVVREVNHAPFRGFNRAQFAVLEAAILTSRLGMLSWDKIDTELAYLRIGLDKTAGAHEREAWAWLMERIESVRREAIGA